MVSKTHTMNLGRSKNKISQIEGKRFVPKQKKITLFSVIEMKPVEILIDKTIYNIKKVNKTM